VLKNNSFNFGTDFSLNAKQTIGALIYGYHNGVSIEKHNVTDVINNGQVDTAIITQSHIERHITNLNYNLNYNGSFGKKDETSLAADFDYSTYNRSSAELLENKSYNAISNQLFGDTLIIQHQRTIREN
jgi:iron complex outermembrane receptor protein